jgi:hypothetical protein
MKHTLIMPHGQMSSALSDANSATTGVRKYKIMYIIGKAVHFGKATIALGEPQ